MYYYWESAAIGAHGIQHLFLVSYTHSAELHTYSVINYEEGIQRSRLAINYNRCHPR